MRPFLEEIPDPKWKELNPCLDKKVPDTEFQRRLSCMARKYKLYLVANMGSVEPCSKATDTDCPKDGRYQYNTNVAYDPRGRHVAKYRKYHTFYLERVTYDTPTTIDYASFKTPFGIVGTFTCFDILFKEPSISLIEKWRIDTIAFPTAWVNVPPYFSAVSFHASFATGTGINLLASNLHISKLNVTGTGIYMPTGPRIFRNPKMDMGSKLLVKSVYEKHTKVWYKKMRFPPKMNTKVDFSTAIFNDTFNFVELPATNGYANVCHGNLCCRAKYRYKTKATDEYYALGAFDGLHTHEGTYYLQMCLLLKCGSMSRSSCGAYVTEATTTFNYLSMFGNFSTPYVFPSLVTSGVTPSPRGFMYNGWHMKSVAPTKGLLSAVLLARNYDLDMKRKKAALRKEMLLSAVERALEEADAFLSSYPRLN